MAIPKAPRGGAIPSKQDFVMPVPEDLNNTQRTRADSIPRQPKTQQRHTNTEKDAKQHDNISPHKIRRPETNNTIPVSAVKNSSTPVNPEETDDRWRIDPRTGKRYKVLKQSSKEAIAASKRNKNGGLTLEQARQLIEEEEDFDVDDLNKSAETFMAHLRVPPNREELEQLRAERVARMRKQHSDFKNTQEDLSEKYGDDDLANC